MKIFELDFNSSLQNWLTCMVYCCHDKTNSKAKLQNIYDKINHFYRNKLKLKQIMKYQIPIV